VKRLAMIAVAASTACGPKAPPSTESGIPKALIARTAPDTRAMSLPAMRTETLANGLELLVLEDHELPVVTIALFWPRGDTSDPAGAAGLTSLGASILRQGTKTATANQINGAIVSAGGELDSGSDMEWSTVQVRVLSGDLALALDVVADVAQNPSFPDDELEDARRQFIGGAKLGLDDPEQLAARFATTRVFGAANPYAVDLTETSLAKITRDDVVAHAARVFGPSGAILAIAGDVDSARLMPALRKRFAGWTSAATISSPAFPALPAAKREIVLVDKPGLTQTFIRVGLPAIPRRHPDFQAVMLANAVLGGSYSSRLTKVVRAEGGKTYGVSSWLSARREQGTFWVSTSTRNTETVATLDLVLREVAKMRNGGVTANELANAKSNRAGSYPRRFETGADIVSEVVTAKMMGLSLDDVTDARRKIVETPLEAVNAAAKTWLDVDRARIVIVGDAREVKSALEKAYGPVEVVDFRADPAVAGGRK